MVVGAETTVYAPGFLLPKPLDTIEQNEPSGSPGMDTLDEPGHWYRTAPVGLALLDRDLRFMRINEWLAAMNGKPVEAHVGRTLEEVFPEIAPQVIPWIRQVIETGEPVIDVEVAGTTPTEPGVEKCWRVSYHPLKDRDGTVHRISTVVQDITEHKQAEEELRTTQQYLDTILLNLPVGVAILEGPDFRWCSAGVLLKNGKIRLNTSFWYLFEPIYSPCPVIFWQTGDLNRELQGKIAVFRPNTAINNNTPLEQHQIFDTIE